MKSCIIFLCVPLTMPLLQVVQRGLLPVGGSLLPQHRGGRGERGEAGGEVNISTHIYTYLCRYIYTLSTQYDDTSESE